MTQEEDFEKIVCEECEKETTYALRVYYSPEENDWKFVCPNCWKDYKREY